MCLYLTLLKRKELEDLIFFRSGPSKNCRPDLTGCVVTVRIISYINAVSLSAPYHYVIL